MDYMEMLQVILASILSGAGFGVMAFLSKAQKGEAFEFPKLAKTAFIGAVVGIVMHFTGQTITAENYQVYITANAGIIAMIDKVWALCRNFYLSKVV